jgi:hypothetical protein
MVCEDQLLFMMTYVKTYTLQVVQGHLFGMVLSKANRWIHVLLPVLLAVLRSLGDAPARSLTALAQRLGVAEADAAMRGDTRNFKNSWDEAQWMNSLVRQHHIPATVAALPLGSTCSQNPGSI